MSDQEPSEEEIVEAVYAFAAAQMEKGVSPRQIRAKLVEMGLDRGAAVTVVSSLTRVRSKAFREAGRKNMLHGALWCIGGLVVTGASYGAAAPGGTYIVASGAIVFGAIQFFRGVGQAGQG